eukprot:g71815.t1
MQREHKHETKEKHDTNRNQTTKKQTRNEAKTRHETKKHATKSPARNGLQEKWAQQQLHRNRSAQSTNIVIAFIIVLVWLAVLTVYVSRTEEESKLVFYNMSPEARATWILGAADLTGSSGVPGPAGPPEEGAGPGGSNGRVESAGRTLYPTCWIAWAERTKWRTWTCWLAWSWFTRPQLLLLGESKALPATSCASLLSARPDIQSGPYWIGVSPSSRPFYVYCDMVRNGGGWTLVRNNLRGSRSKRTTELQWKAAVSTTPLISGDITQSNLESFMVYIGLKHWASLGSMHKFRYDWAPDYDTPNDQSYQCDYRFTDLDTFQITFDIPTCVQTIGSVVPGIVRSSQNAKFSAYDRDLDDHAQSCATYYSSTPFWYRACWDSHIDGGGELSGDGYFNGAYWEGIQKSWGQAGGTGAGNGWIWVK